MHCWIGTESLLREVSILLLLLLSQSGPGLYYGCRPPTHVTGCTLVARLSENLPRLSVMSVGDPHTRPCLPSMPVPWRGHFFVSSSTDSVVWMLISLRRYRLEQISKDVMQIAVNALQALSRYLGSDSSSHHGTTFLFRGLCGCQLK